jgi:hypothetical protein
MTAAALQLKDTETATAKEAGMVLAWARRRPAWTRTDTARWLNERSEPLLAWLRRRSPRAPAHSRQMGYWLKDQDPTLFARAHERLARCKTPDRDQLLTDEVLK